MNMPPIPMCPLIFRRPHLPRSAVFAGTSCFLASAVIGWRMCLYATVVFLCMPEPISVPVGFGSAWCKISDAAGNVTGVQRYRPENLGIASPTPCAIPQQQRPRGALLAKAADCRSHAGFDTDQRIGTAYRALLRKGLLAE